MDGTYSTRRKAFDSIYRSNLGKLPFIESHRGCNLEFPENTLSAFRRAIEYNCDSIELDIWLTKDLIPIVVHGKNNGLLSIDNEEVMINQTEFNYLIAKNSHIPKLEDVFSLCKGMIFINIEIKDKSFRQCLMKVIELVDLFKIRDQICLSSFHHDYWKELRYLGIDNIEFGYLFNKEHIPIKRISKCTINLYYKDIDHKIVIKAHSEGMGVLAYFPMTDEDTDDEYIKLFDYGVDVICTNDPRRVIELREKYYYN